MKMKLIIKKSILLEALLNTSKAISQKNLIPILTGIKFDLKKEGLYLYASDSDISIRSFIDKDEIVKKVKCVYQSELLFPDTALQFYMGVLKAQLEEHCVDNEVVRSYQQLVNQEKDYLNKEEWLSEQVQKLNNELKKFNR